jgi:hypothetical protein
VLFGKQTSFPQPREALMRAFSLLTTDTRYSVPTLTLVIAEDERQAIERAEANLRESNFHQAVELRDDRRSIYRRSRTDERDLLN